MVCSLVDSCGLFISLTDLLLPDQSEGSSSAQQGSSGSQQGSSSAALTNPTTQTHSSSIPPSEDSNQPLDLSKAPAAASDSSEGQGQSSGAEQVTPVPQGASTGKGKAQLKPPLPEIQASKSTLYTLNPLGIGVKYLKPKYKMPPGLPGSTR